MLGVAKTLNIWLSKTYIACIYLTLITSGNLYLMEMPCGLSR